MNKYFHSMLIFSGIITCLFTHTALAVGNLGAQQVTALFSGKSVSGKDLEIGSTFKQYFDPNGTVLSDAQGFKSIGKWRVDNTGAHCIKWDSEDREQCVHISPNGDGTYTKIQHKNIKKIPLVVYKKFTDGNVFAQGGEPVDVEEFKQSSTGSQATGELLQAVVTQNLDRLDKAIAAGADVNTTFKKHRTALFLAVKKGNEQLIEKLIAAGADVNVQDGKGNTPLIVATKDESLSSVQLLLHNGADAKIKNNAGEDALTIAKSKKLVEIAEIIVENIDGGTALGMFIDIKNKHITEEQFRQAAVNAFEARNWHVDKAENNVVSGTYERNDRIFKTRMIYEPDLLLIKFESGMGYPKANYLIALRTLFFRQIDNKNP